jgi:hypothetical protein
MRPARRCDLHADATATLNDVDPQTWLAAALARLSDHRAKRAFTSCCPGIGVRRTPPLKRLDQRGLDPQDRPTGGLTGCARREGVLLRNMHNCTFCGNPLRPLARGKAAGAACFTEWPRSIHTAPVPLARQPAWPPAGVCAGEAAAAGVASSRRDPSGRSSSPARARRARRCLCALWGHRIDLMRGHNAMWRCVYPQRR